MSDLIKTEMVQFRRWQVNTLAISLFCASFGGALLFGAVVLMAYGIVPIVWGIPPEVLSSLTSHTFRAMTDGLPSPPIVLQWVSDHLVFFCFVCLEVCLLYLIGAIGLAAEMAQPDAGMRWARWLMLWTLPVGGVLTVVFGGLGMRLTVYSPGPSVVQQAAVGVITLVAVGVQWWLWLLLVELNRLERASESTPAKSVERTHDGQHPGRDDKAGSSDQQGP